MGKSPRSKLSLFVLFFAGILLLIFLNERGFLNSTKNALLIVSVPLQNVSALAADKVNYFGQALREIKNLKKENEKLLNENLELRGVISGLEEIKRENDFLRQQLGLEEKPDDVLILAGVIGRDPLTFGRAILIDKGARDGVREKTAVISAGNILVGQIIEVYENSAKVRLLTDILSKVPALTQDSRMDGLIKGDGTSSLTMDLISKEKELAVGERAISSGLEGIYPKGLLIGEIEEVFSADNQFFQKAKIKAAVDFQNLESVLVFKKQ